MSEIPVLGGDCLYRVCHDRAAVSQQNGAKAGHPEVRSLLEFGPKLPAGFDLVLAGFIVHPTPQKTGITGDSYSGIGAAGMNASCPYAMSEIAGYQGDN
jgi:hypothetical protein